MTATTAAQRLKVKEMLVSQLRLKMDPSEIDDAAPLFGEGLGLDSIDALELVVGVEQAFGAVIATQDEGKRVLRSVETLAAYLVEKGRLA